MLLVLVAIVWISMRHMSIITTVIISIIINLTSLLWLLFPFPIPLLNFGTSLRTAFPNGAPASSSPTARAYALVPPTPTLMVIIPFIVLSARTTPPMRALFMAPMPVGAPTSASTPAAPSLVPPKQLAPQLPDKNKYTQTQTEHTTEHKT